MQNLRQLSSPELAQLIHCVSALAGMKRVLPAELYIKLDTYRADLLAEQEDRVAQPVGAAHSNGTAQPNSTAQPNGAGPNGSQAHSGHCLCLCS